MREKGIDTLEKLLEPYTAEEFFGSVWGRTYKHVSGWPGKFARLLPWQRLNDVLEQHRLDFPRLRLARDGKTLPSTTCIRRTGTGQRTVPRLLSAELTSHLREGATLVLDAVDELQEPVRELAEGLEYRFRERVQVNAYAGWRTSNGFDLHWDDHDVFILQVTGRKRWKVYGMTEPYPLTQDRGRGEKPTHDPVWEGTLVDGDVLYIPRGWWHVALPLDEPTLHLTVGIHNRTGLDLLRWLAERLRERESFRQDVPRFAAPGERAAHMTRLRDELLAEWDDCLLERYLDDYDAMAEPRPRLNLPWGATQGVLPPEMNAVVRLTAPRPLSFKLEDGVVEFACHGKRWRFAADALIILNALVERRLCSVSELCEEARGRLDESTVRAFLGELILHGLAAIVED